MPAPEGVELGFPEDGGCFGCSPTNPAGMQLRFRRDGSRVHAAYRIPDRFHGAPGIAHGGIVATILDEVSCAAAVFVIDRRVVTGELVVRYHRPVPVEVPLEIDAEIVGDAHPRYVEIEARVREGGELLARSRGKFFYQERQVAP
ncbi:MAG TPA: PaaI family thioesterase [Candidatus Eisenbacteria bacterium]|nr:PaaI family thioesterase [Candidatus Eisenbacteria bacterium]